MTDINEESVVVWEGGDHQCIWLGAGDPEAEKGIASNQFLIVHAGRGVLLDPGGYHVFARVLHNALSAIERDGIDAIFLSHQDPDVCGSLISWMELRPDVTVVISRLWERFVTHFALPVAPRLELLPDSGGTFQLAGAEIRFIPAHFLHSPGNFVVYDPTAKILFSGDVGASIRNTGDPLFVEDFDAHVEKMEGFHRRYVPCNKAVQQFLRRLDGLEIDMICPQHGASFRGHDVGRFVEWIGNLDVGVDYRDWGSP